MDWHSLIYPLTLSFGLVFSACAWEQLSVVGTPPAAWQRDAIYMGAVLGIVIGAKLAYSCSEGFLDVLDPSLDQRTTALRLLQGKSVTGALLGGYAGVEMAERRVGDRRQLRATRVSTRSAVPRVPDGIRTVPLL